MTKVMTLENFLTAFSPYTAISRARAEKTTAATRGFTPNRVSISTDTVAMQLAPPRHMAMRIS